MQFIKKASPIFLAIAIGLILSLLIKVYIFRFVSVSGDSMEPNLYNRERVIALNQSEIRRGSIVIFDAFKLAPDANKNTLFVKRVIALPGDTVSADTQGVRVNGRYVNQRWISEKQQRITGTWKNLHVLSKKAGWKTISPITVPKNDYFVLGDHRSVSFDSRYWGYVPKTRMRGVVKLMPFNNSKKDVVNSGYTDFFK